MPFSLLPGAMTDRIVNLTPDYLRKQDIQLLMMDFDNTIVSYITDEPEQDVLQWLKTMQASGILLCVVSNSHRDRVKIFCKKYGLDCITHARKPFSRGIRQCLSQYELPPDRCALVGDQIFTDVLGANCCRVRSFLVKAICNHNFLLKFRHFLELPWIWLARNRKI